jgi:hypothetical protein
MTDGSVRLCLCGVVDIKGRGGGGRKGIVDTQKSGRVSERSLSNDKVASVDLALLQRMLREIDDLGALDLVVLNIRVRCTRPLLPSVGTKSLLEPLERDTSRHTLVDA